MNRSELALLAVGLAVFGLPGVARADLITLSGADTPAAAPPAQAAASPEPSLRLDTSSGVASEVQAQKAVDVQQLARSTRYGEAGSRWWTVGAVYANDFNDVNDVNLHGAFSQFLADDFEFAVEAAGWYFDQPGTDTGGVSGSMIFRWHVLHADDYDWSVFADVGIGLLAAFDDVPDGGTSFNFLPRLGGGFTKAIGDSGARLMVGARWHHISNARIFGNDRNPSRDALAGYVAITFPF